MIKLFESKYQRLRLIEAMFVGAIIAANLTSVKMVSLFGGLITVAGTFVYVATFLFTDVVNDVYGKREARNLVMMGIYAQLLFLGFVILSVVFKFPGWWENQEAYKSVVMVTPRIFVASFITYLVSQHHDVWFFAKIKGWTKGRQLWLRNNLSTIVSQFYDAILFTVIAFAFVVPFKILVVMAFTSWLIKVIAAAVDTPFCYLGVRFLKGGVSDGREREL